MPISTLISRSNGGLRQLSFNSAAPCCDQTALTARCGDFSTRRFSLNRSIFSVTALLLVLSGCQTVDGDKTDSSNSAQQHDGTPAAESPQKITHQERETDPIKQQINAYIDPVSKRTSDELSFAYDQYKPKFSARMRALRDKYTLPPQKIDVLLTIANDGNISDCMIRNGGPSATAAMRGDMCYAWSWVFFGKKIPSLPPYTVSIQTPIPGKKTDVPQTAQTSGNPGTATPTQKVLLADTVQTAGTGTTSAPVSAPAPSAPVTSAPAAVPPSGPSASGQFTLGPPTF